MEVGTYRKIMHNLVEKKKTCKSNEAHNLEYYCECFIKIFRAYRKTEVEEMLSYVRDILNPAFPLVIEYFLEQADAYLELEGKEPQRQNIVMEDIEKSLIEFDDFFDAIVRSTNYADRILIQTAPMDSAMRYMSPKLCRYYSLLLDGYVKLFGEELENEYAFCVYPSINQVAEAHILFQERQKSGKVCVIRVPGRHFANVKMIRTWIFHEMFHVVPSENMRLREKRDRFYVYMILWCLEKNLLKDCNIDEFSIEVEEIRKILVNPVGEKVFEEIKKNKSDKRIFYSERFQNICFKEIRKFLYDIQENGQEKFVDYVIEKNNKENVLNSMSRLPGIQRNFAQIRSNIFKMTKNSEIMGKCDIYMKIFREAFADLFTVITLHLSKVEYFNALEAFLWKRGKESEMKYDRITLLLRAAFVVEVMCDGPYIGLKEDLNVFESWKKTGENYFNEEGSLLFEIEKFRKDIFQSWGNKKSDIDIKLWRNESEQEKREGIVINNRMKELYQEYFKYCCEKYLKFRKDHENEISGIETRFKINDIVTVDDIILC